MKRICAYKRNTLIKMGVRPIDLKRVANPYDYPFVFEKKHCQVEISSVVDILPRCVYDNLLSFIENIFPIVPHSCHSTAGIIARFLTSQGCETTVCDGFYERIQTADVYTHTFCRIGDSYFCPTIEFTRGYEAIAGFHYYVEREFSSYEYFLMQLTMGYAIHDELGAFWYASSLTYDFYVGSSYESECILDENGYIYTSTNEEITESHRIAVESGVKNDSEYYSFLSSITLPSSEEKPIVH